MDNEMPAWAKLFAPQVGDVYEWEPLKSKSRERVTVTEVTWNGEEVWVTSVDNKGRSYPNPLSRWIEATVLVTCPDDEEENSPANEFHIFLNYDTSVPVGKVFLNDDAAIHVLSDKTLSYVIGPQIAIDQTGKTKLIAFGLFPADKFAEKEKE